jgi:hypothetical protein
MSLDELLRSHRIERVEADPDAASAMLVEADRHRASAHAIAHADPNGAYQLAYDAARKAVQAHMSYEGLRVRVKPGAHAVMAQYARLQLNDELGRRLDAMRARRNRSEYGVAHLGTADVAAASDVAAQLVVLVRQLIA